MKKISKTILLLSTSILVASCGNFNKQTTGTAVGGVAGGLLGSQFGKGEGQIAATAIGALAGALIGGQIGAQFDEYDKLMMQRSTRQALEYNQSGVPIEWQNPDSGNKGRTTPQPAYRNREGNYCRRYTQEVWISGQKQLVEGLACRQPDGNWKIIK